MRRMWNVSGLETWCWDVFFFFPQKKKKNPCFSTSRICTMLHPLIIVPLSTCLTARGLNRGSAGNYSTPPHPPACGVSTIILLLQSRLEPMGNQSVNIKHWMLDGQSRFFFFPLAAHIWTPPTDTAKKNLWRILTMAVKNLTWNGLFNSCLLICINCIWDLAHIVTKACVWSLSCVCNLHRSDGHVK